MMWIFVIFIVIQVIGYALVVVSLLRSVFKKDRRKMRRISIWLIALFLFSGFVFEVLPGSKVFWWPIEAIESKSYTEKLMGMSFVLPEPVCCLVSKRHFNGDGSSVIIYQLNENISKHLAQPDSTFFTDYPRKGNRDDWGLVNWTKTPLKQDHEYAFEFASYAENKSEFNLEELLHEQGNYYAFKYLKVMNLGDEALIMNVDFYLISPQRNILIAVNANT